MMLPDLKAILASPGERVLPFHPPSRCPIDQVFTCDDGFGIFNAQIAGDGVKP